MLFSSFFYVHFPGVWGDLHNGIIYNIISLETIKEVLHMATNYVKLHEKQIDKLIEQNEALHQEMKEMKD